MGHERLDLKTSFLVPWTERKSVTMRLSKELNIIL